MTGRAPGLVGKLPAHGDFVRRGGPAAVLAGIDAWLDAELGAAVRAGAAPEAAMAALDGWRFGFGMAGHRVLAVAVAAGDRVGRAFPLVGLIAREDGDGDPAGAENWCARAAAILAEARDGGLDADGALAALAAVPPPPAGTPAGWWREGGSPSGDAALPSGPAFAALLEPRA